MKIAFLTDTHIGLGNDHPVHRYSINRFFRWFWEDTQARQIQVVCHGGDIVDNRTRISFNGVNQLHSCIIDPVKEHGVDFYAIVGNHDTTYRTTLDVSCAALLKDKPGIRVYNSVTDVILPDGTSLGLIPWINKENHAQVCEYLKTTKSKVLLGHLEIRGALMMRGNVSEHGEDAALFERFDAVFSGHYHHKNSIGNIHYIGNIAQMNWGDYGDPRGYTIWDTETNEFELIENPFSPFQKLYYNDVDNDYEDLSFLDNYDYTNLIIKVIVSEKKNPYYLDRFVDKLNENGAFSVTIVEHDSIEFSGVQSGADNVAEFTVDTLTILDEYIQSTAMTDEQAKRVKTLMREIYAEALSREGVE